MKHLYLQFLNRNQPETNGVLGPDKKTEKDFVVGGIFGWGKYTPKHESLLIPTLSFKNQAGRNTCTFESAIVQKEVQERTELSVRSLVSYAKSKGYIQGNGFSSLKLSQQAIQEFGALSLGKITEEVVSWSLYSSPKISKSMRDEAYRHRSKSFWRIDNLDELYKSLDEGNIVQVAAPWHTSYNMSGGLRAPFILHEGKGRKVGYHAFVFRGYKLYGGYRVLIAQNSFGDTWGDNGLFYVREDHAENILDMFGGFLTLDIPEDVGHFLRDMNLKAVKSTTDPKIYLIHNGQKRWFVNMNAMAKNGYYQFQLADGKLLRQIPDGPDIT